RGGVRADLGTALGAGQERQRGLGVGTTGRVTQAVQVLLHLGVADEVVDALVEERHRYVAGRGEIPLQGHVDVVRLQRQQARVLGGARGAEAQQHRTVRGGRW